MRLHPIYKRWLMHFGVDVPARLGTPIQNLADGVVIGAGRMASLGLCVRLHHNGGVETVYAHCSKLAAGITVGARVKRGQILAFVGLHGGEYRPSSAPIHENFWRCSEASSHLSIGITRGEQQPERKTLSRSLNGLLLPQELSPR